MSCDWALAPLNATGSGRTRDKARSSHMTHTLESQHPQNRYFTLKSIACIDSVSAQFVHSIPALL